MQKKLIYISILVFSSTIGLLVAQNPTLQRVQNTPDLCQGDVPNGRNYCGPATASNGLVWLSLAGFPDLFDAGNDPQKEQIKLVQKLASPKYMNAKDGTGVSKMAYGIKKYLKENGIKKYRFDYEGWRSIQKTTKRLSKIPKINTIKKTLDKNAVIFLNIGRYKNRDGDYYRSGGHWLTIVGLENEVLYAYDPGARNGSEKKLHKLTLTPIERGNLKGDKKGMPLSAKGYFILGKNSIAKNKQEVTIIDGILYLTVEDKPIKQDSAGKMPSARKL